MLHSILFDTPDTVDGFVFDRLALEASGDPATAVPGYLRRLKELAVKYSD